MHVLLEILRDWRCGHTTCCACSVHIKMAVTVDELQLAEEAGLSLQCLEKAFRVEHIHVLSEFCDQWENIGYHLKLNLISILSGKVTPPLKGRELQC